MKRYGNLTASIADPDNLMLAYWKAEVRQYVASLQGNISALQRQIEQGRVECGNYRIFTIFDPKERQICAAPFPQRVLHHALMNVCGPIFDKWQIFDSYASQKGKGTYAALERAKMFHKRYAYCVKMDVRKFFDSIHHPTLKGQLARLFKDWQVVNAFYDIIDSYCVQPDRGLPIGNLTSQYFANHYLASLDHYAKEELKVGGYVRYMDDILIYGDDRERLREQASLMRKYVEERLQLQFKVVDLRPTSKCTQFLGYRISREAMLLSHRSQRRYVLRMKDYITEYHSGHWSQEVLQRHLSPLIAFASKAQSYRLRQKTLRGIEEVLTV